jgi:hypothetical protein
MQQHTRFWLRPAGAVLTGLLLAGALLGAAVLAPPTGAQAPCGPSGSALLAPAGPAPIGLGPVTGQVNVLITGTSTAVNAIINGLLPGQRPTLSLQTTAGAQQLVGTPPVPTPPGGPTLLNGTVAGIAVPGSLVTVSVTGPAGAPVLVAQGPLVCAGGAPPPAPLAPPPPLALDFVPPPPPPPPPPPLAREFPAIPIIPEADTLALVLGGLLVGGGVLVGRRLWARRALVTASRARG